MILEFSAATVIGCLSGLAVYESVMTARARRRPAGARLATAAGVGQKDRLYGLGARVMDLMPAAWSQWLADTLGRDVERQLVAAGAGSVDVKSFVGAEILLVAAGFAAGWAAAGGAAAGLVVGAAAAYIAGRWPRYQIGAKVELKRLDFARLLPDFIDMLAIGVEAGLSIDRALRLYCERFDNLLSRAFAEALMEIELGKPRRSSFQELAQKNQNDDLTWFITSLMQAEKLGAPLARALKEQAKWGRERQSELVKEVSATAPVRMLFPIAGLILPALLIVIIGPAFLQFML